MFGGTSCLVTWTIPFSGKIFQHKYFYLYLCNEESGFWLVSSPSLSINFFPFSWNEIAKAYLTSGTGIFKHMKQFHYGHHYVLWTTLTGCRFRHKMIHNKAAVHKHNDQLLNMWWSTNLKKPNFNQSGTSKDTK